MLAPVQSPSVRSSLAATLSWAVYLGMSWTWCIGMFLPVILISEFGLPIWLVFAIPNVVGAAAMGWVLKRQGQSEQMVANHRSACVAFSAVTISFQIFFLFWMVWVGVIRLETALPAVIGGLAVGWIARRRSAVDLTAGWLVLGLSTVVLIRSLLTPRLPSMQGMMPDRLHGAWIGLPPVCLLGFLLCPYLDLTFHRARQSLTPAAAKSAFTLGFGFFFLAMIVLTVLYTADLTGQPGTFRPDPQFDPVTAIVTWVGLHMAVQIGFTISVHVRAVRELNRPDLIWWIAALVMLAAAILAVVKNQFLEAPWLGNRQMSSGEAVYRLFMSFYGLVFPPYVLICMVPWRKTAGPTVTSLVVCGLTILLAAPFFWVGFLMERMAWLLPGVLMVLAGALVMAMISRRELAPADRR